jgi:hypothetical protein
VTFELLDVIKQTGNVMNPGQQVSLADAANTVTKMINNNNFVVSFDATLFPNGVSRL